MDAAGYKRVFFDLTKLNSISDAFEAKHTELPAEKKKRDYHDDAE